MRIGKRERRGLLRPIYVRRIATIQRNKVYQWHKGRTTLVATQWNLLKVMVA